MLPKNQCAFAVNTTFRGDFATDRPPVRLVSLDPAIEASIQGAFGSGLFQGGTAFKSDFASESLMFSIAGRLFDVIPSADPAVPSTGKEVTIPGDANPATIAQAWLWQAERWMIVNNGKSIPIFYDGVSSRRSENTITTVGTVSANFSVPPIGGFVNVTLTTPYTGLLNSVLNLNEVDANGNVRKITNYMVTKVGGNVDQYQVTLKNLTATPGTVYSNGNNLYIIPANLGNIVTNTNLGGFKYRIALTIPVPSYVTGGLQVLIGTTTYNITSIAADRSYMNIARFSGTGTPAVNNPVTLKNYSVANLVVGTLDSSFTAPAVNANVTTYLTSQFTGPNGQVVIIGTDQYSVVSSQTNSPAASTAIQVQNLNDNADLDPATSLPLQVLANSYFENLPELPPARMGTYGRGRVWQAGIDGQTFIAGDIVGGSSGSPAYSGRDAVLKVTENTFLVGGGAFRVPGAGEVITALAFSAILDASLGQGPLQVFTNKNIFSCNTPTDRTTWQNLTNPILTEPLKGAGAASHYGVTNINADIIFRSPDGQIRSEILSSLDFNRWGNTPISFEVSRILAGENLDFMNFCSVMEFDNRLLMSSNPVQGSSGVYWAGLAVMNFDPVSKLQQKEQSIWEGLWTGLNILQLVRFQNTDRAFALTVNPTTNAFEIYEFLPTGTNHFDDGKISIPWVIETPMLFRSLSGKGIFDLIKLEDGELYVSNVIGKVTFKVEYRPDYDSCWYPWHSWFICAQYGSDPTVENPQYRKRMALGQPPISVTDCNVNTDLLPTYGTMFQLRLTITGHCVLNGFKIAASIQPQPQFEPPICNIDE